MNETHRRVTHHSTAGEVGKPQPALSDYVYQKHPTTLDIPLIEVERNVLKSGLPSHRYESVIGIPTYDNICHSGTPTRTLEHPQRLFHILTQRRILNHPCHKCLSTGNRHIL